MAALRTGMRWLLLLAVGLTVLLALVVFNPWALLLGDEAEEAEARREQGQVTVSDLTNSLESDGELVFGAQRQITPYGAGTMTSLAANGSPVPASTVLFEVDGQPMVALIGDVPAWRSMRVDDVGIDVAQLERNLVALGYDPEGALTADDTFTEFTATVVERWQDDLGIEVTGSVALGSVVFVPDHSRITSVNSTVGQNVGASSAAVLSVSSSNRQAVFTVEAGALDTIDVGTEVSIRLPDRSTLSATVAELGPTGAGSWTATAMLSSTAEGVMLPEGEAVPITVAWKEVVAEQAITVQANALTRLDNGSYVVEVVHDDESTSFVEVQVGAQTGSTVEVRTDLPPGTIVITP